MKDEMIMGELTVSFDSGENVRMQVSIVLIREALKWYAQQIEVLYSVKDIYLSTNGSTLGAFSFR